MPQSTAEATDKGQNAHHFTAAGSLTFAKPSSICRTLQTSHDQEANPGIKGVWYTVMGRRACRVPARIFS